MSIEAIGASNPYTRIASGSQINKAADNAAGLAISKGMESQIKSSQQNLNNISDMGNLLKTAEGSMSNINDSLLRIRELALQASNGTMTESDKGIIQKEVEQLKSSIQDAAKNTEFNTMKLLDGSFSDKTVAMNTNGSGSKISIGNSSLEALGIKEFDVTGSFDINKIDDAISKVNESQSSIGSATNAFEFASNSINSKVISMTSSMSKIADADVAKEISNLKKTQILDQYKTFMQMEKSNTMKQQIGMYADFKL